MATEYFSWFVIVVFVVKEGELDEGVRLSLSEYVKEMAECMKKERDEIPVKWRREYNQLQQDRSKQGYNEFATRFQRGRNKVTLRSQQGHNQVATRLQQWRPRTRLRRWIWRNRWRRGMWRMWVFRRVMRVMWRRMSLR